MNNFPLYSRFNDPNFDVLPLQVLQGILPLEETYSSEVWHGLISNVDHIALTNFPGFVNAFDVDTDDPEAGKKLLAEKISIARGESIIFFWSPVCSVATDWRTVTENWTSFFYPSDDNIVILSESFLVTFSEERFCIYRESIKIPNLIGRSNPG